MSTNTDTPMSFDDIDVSDVAAAPSFSSPPSGAYLVMLSMTQKMVAEKRAISIDMELVETLELGTQHTELPHDAGQKFNSLAFIDKVERIPYVKRDLSVFFEAAGTNSINTMVNACQNLRCKVVLNYDKQDWMRAVSYEIIG